MGKKEKRKKKEKNSPISSSDGGVGKKGMKDFHALAVAESFGIIPMEISMQKRRITLSKGKGHLFLQLKVEEENMKPW